MTSLPRSSPLGLTLLGLLMYEPQHVYGMQQLIKQWGKDLVVNVEQRTSLHRMVDRLAKDGLIAVRETQRNHAYPERTVYEITEAGRAAARAWLTEMLAAPRPEFPRFPAALSHLMMLPPPEAAAVLERRLASLTTEVANLEAGLATHAEGGVDRVGLLEVEYLHLMARSELTWLATLVDDLKGGRLTWSPAMSA